MEPLLDFAYLLAPLDAPDSSPKSSRLKLRLERDHEFEKHEAYENYRQFGPAQEGLPAPEQPDWTTLSRNLQQHLATRCKDLWVCCWLVECLVARDGFRGLAEGLQLLYRMCDECWDQIEPKPSEEGGVEYTLRMVLGFSKGDHLRDQITLAPITPAAGPHEPASCGTLDSLDAAVRSQLVGAAGEEFVRQLGADVHIALEYWGKLETRLKELSGGADLTLARLRETLESCRRTILNTYPQLADVASEAPTVEHALTVTTPAAPLAASSVSLTTNGSHLTNREQAFRTLEAISRYFRENEPNSPVSLALMQAIRWGRMSFQELMNEVVDDPSTKESILRWVGGREKNEDG